MSYKKIIACLCLFVSANLAYSEDYVFNSYHLYATDEDKYLPTNVQKDSSIVRIDEINQEIELNLYNKELGKKLSFSLKISYKLNLGLNASYGTLYICENNSKQQCVVYKRINEDDILIDFYHFHSAEQQLSCWVRTK